MPSPLDNRPPAEIPALCKGQRLRIAKPSVAEREWGLGRDAVGTLLCCYRVRSGTLGSAERVDVVFASGRTVWGAPVEAFAPVPPRR